MNPITSLRHLAAGLLLVALALTAMIVLLWSIQYGGLAVDASRVLLALLIGLCLFLLLFQAMFHLPVNLPRIYAAITALPWLRFTRRSDPVHCRLPALWRAGRTPWSHSLLMAIGLLPVVFLAIIANRPESGHDALSLHRWIPEYVAGHGYWHFDVTKSIWSVFPMSASVSFTWAYLLGGEMAARLINPSFILLTGALLKILQETDTHFVMGRWAYVEGCTVSANFVRDDLIIQHEHREWFLGKVRPDRMFDEAMIENEALNSDLAPWRSRLPVERDGDLERITKPHKLYQRFRVEAGDRIQVSYTICCPEPTQMRLELIWGSHATRYLGNGMDIVQCLGEAQTFVREFNVPKDCEYGNIHVQPFGDETTLLHAVTVTR